MAFQDSLSFRYMRLHNRMSFLCGTLMFAIKSFLFGVESDGIVKCWGRVHIMRMPGSQIRIGKNVSIVSSSNRCSSSSIFAPTKLRTWSDTAKIIIEDNVGLNGTSIVARSKTISIGQGTMIAPNVAIVDSDFHAVYPPGNRIMNPGIEEDRDVFIGKNVWLGMQSMVLKGARIGDNSVIAAGSVVRGDIPSGVLAAGVPAKVIKTLREGK